MNPLVLLLLFQISFSAGLNINLTTIAAQSKSFICCETYAPTQQLFYCVYKNQPNFNVYDSAGNLQPFVPDAAGFGVGEQRVAAVQPSPTNPFPIGDWHLGDIFIGAPKGAVVKIVNASTIINPWVTLPETGTPQQTVFDRTGTVYDGDLIVSFAKSVYRINAQGNYTLIIKSDKLYNYEGLEVVPIDKARYGPLSGTILIPQNTATYGSYSESKPETSWVAAITPNGTILSFPSGCYVDQIWFVHEYDNFYGIDYSGGKVLSSTWDKIEKEKLDGEIIIQCEYTLGVSGLRRLFYDTTKKVVSHEGIGLSTGSSTPKRFEHGCFTRGGSASILPGGFSFCYYMMNDTQTLDTITVNHLSSVKSNKTVLQNWGINGVYNTFTFPSTGLPKISNASMTVSFFQDGQNGFYLQIVNGEPKNGNGHLELSLTYSGLSDSEMKVRIQNNPSDSYLWDAASGQGRFVWDWKKGSTGVLLGPVAAIPGLKPFSFEFDVLNVTGIDSVRVVSGDGKIQSQTIKTGSTWTLKRVSCNCGDGNAGGDSLLKECEWTLPNNTCCTRDCHYRSQNTICNSPPSGDLCTLPSYCTGKSAKCPNMTIAQECNCTFPYTGYLCKEARCDLLKNCSSCNAIPSCGWCCDGTSGGSCVKSNSTCKNSYPRSCAACPASCGAGSCECGVCVCPAGYTGSRCEMVIDCHGKPVAPGETVDKIDICGVCGGDGTSCLGCDGIPFGKLYDACGVCGGDGSSCYDACGNYECKDCAGSDLCGWCENQKKCLMRVDEDQCSGGFKDSCGSVPVPIVVGATIGAGAIAGIVVGAAIFAGVVGFGGKKGYDYYAARQAQMSAANSNPLYADSGRTGNNPLYENDVEMKAQ